VPARPRPVVVEGPGMGKRKPPVLDVDKTARAVAAMALGRAAAHQERLAAETALLARLADMPLEELTRHATGRQWMAAVLASAGATEEEIARALGLRGGRVSAHRLRQHPVVARLVALIRAHQLALVLRGEFGVQSQARAAAPAVVEHLTELAGAQRAGDGTRRGRAGRDRDAIAAGQVVLDVAGVRVQRHQHQHVHQVFLEEMSDAELEAFASDGTCPERLQGALGPPDQFTGLPALPTPAVNGPGVPARADPRPRGPGGRG
jgi:hypothetical protein